jgi:parallel beta-helix repeat protein
MNRKTVITTLSAATLIATAGLLFAGPLSAPVGPITGTYKTLSEVEPRIAINQANTPGDANSLFKITQPGSYYLTGNIAGVAGKHGIEITASGVTLDLMGFDLAGFVGIGSVDGVSVTVSNLTNIAVVNGSVRNWTDDGVDLGSFSATNCRIEGVLASGNVGAGIFAGITSQVSKCSAAGGAHGIYTRGGSTVSDCSATGTGNVGIAVEFGSTVTNCSAYLNGADGIEALGGSTITFCSARDNAGSGISTAGGTANISNCTAYSNDGHGIFAGLSSTVSNCLSYLNSAVGISVTLGSTVEGCTVRSNGLDGIVVSSGCFVRGNSCEYNGLGAGDGANIHATSVDNRIEGNNCSSADRGIDVDISGNIIVKNTCSGNTFNWVIAANNYYGPIIDRTGVATAAVNGSAAASTLATTDPNANFSY